MKKLIAIAFLFTAVAFSAKAQYSDVRSIRYRDIAEDFDTNGYTYDISDPYAPGWAGIASFLIPGLGQWLDNELGRGAVIFAGNAALSVLGITEASYLFYSAARGSENLTPNERKRLNTSIGITTGAMVLTFAGQLALNIWNTCDAIKIAKVKNIYYRTTSQASLPIDVCIEPYLAAVPASGNSIQPSAGVSLRLTL